MLLPKLNIKFDQPTILAKDLHKDLKINTRYDMWIGRIISKYGFLEGIDFCTIQGKSSGGRKPSIHYITINMAKEICMLDNSDIGRKIRIAYIELENEVRKNRFKRLISIELRKTLTDKIKESGENERMHGFAYSNYTKLVYKLCGIPYIKKQNFRDTLDPYDLERVNAVEKIIDSLLSIGKKYEEIKIDLSKLLIFKDNKELE